MKKKKKEKVPEAAKEEPEPLQKSSYSEEEPEPTAKTSYSEEELKEEESEEE